MRVRHHADLFTAVSILLELHKELHIHVKLVFIHIRLFFVISLALFVIQHRCNGYAITDVSDARSSPRVELHRSVTSCFHALFRDECARGRKPGHCTTKVATGDLGNKEMTDGLYLVYFYLETCGLSAQRVPSPADSLHNSMQPESSRTSATSAYFSMTFARAAI